MLTLLIAKFNVLPWQHSITQQREKLWKENKGWVRKMTDECTWYQSSNKSVCVNGTLLALSLEDNEVGRISSERDCIAYLSRNIGFERQCTLVV